MILIPPARPWSAAGEAAPAETAPAESADPYCRANDLPLLAVLALAHAFVDFCGGIVAPMIPRMENKFSLSLGGVAAMLAVMTIMANFSQPLAGWLADRSRTARLLIVAPVFSAASFFVGWTSDPRQAAALFFVSGAAIGAFHPCSFILAQTTLPRRPALASAIFISTGILGGSAGAMVSGVWMEARGFESFHLLAAIALAVTLLMLLRRIHGIEVAPYVARLRPRTPAGSTDPRAIPVGLLWFIGFFAAFEAGGVLFFAPKLFKVLYDSEGLGGKACFGFGLLSGLSSFAYARWADRGATYKSALYGQLLSLAPMIGFYFAEDAATRVSMILLMGVTFGGIPPMVTSMARRARGFSMGLRAAMMMGGMWGAAGLAHCAMAQLPDFGFSLTTVVALLALGPLLTVPALAYAARRYPA